MDESRTPMESILHEAARYIALAIETIAIVVVALGSARAVVDGARLALAHQAGDAVARAVRLRYAHVLVAGLTFQLAADVVATSVAPTRDEVGRLGAVAGIRTFLSYFLDRELAARKREQLEGAFRVPAQDRAPPLEIRSTHG